MASRKRLTATKRIKLLFDIADKIRGKLDVNEILYQILDSLREVVAYDAAGIFVLNRGAFLPRHGPPANLIAGIAHYGYGQIPVETDPMLSMGKGIVGHVIRTNEIVVLPDVRMDERYVAGRRQTISEIAVPITMDGQPIGALNLESDSPAAFGSDDVGILRFFADAAAISIERAVLHRHLMEKTRIEKQLRIAQEVQSRLLPSKSPVIPGYSVSAVCLSAFDIGGDYFDYLVRPDGRIGTVIADVTGKGIPAALILATFRALVRVLANQISEPSLMATALNKALMESTGKSAYVTAVYGILDGQEGRFEFANCGHTPVLHVQSDGHVHELPSNGPILGAFDEALCTTGTVLLAPGDMLVLHTDGVVECLAESGEEFGMARLTDVVIRARSLPPDDVIGEIIRATRDFMGADVYRDDFTLMIIKRG